MRIAACLLVITVSSIGAQNPAVAAARENWRDGHDYIVRSAEMLPDSLFAFKPTPVVRSFAEQFGHVAGSEFMFCAAALGEPERAEDAVEKTAKTKADLVKALKDAGTYCDRAYALTDAAANGTTRMFGATRTRLFVLMQNATHDWEHYGNLVTYLRLKGLVPPSSQ